jgi:hypothetical protein
MISVNVKNGTAQGVETIKQIVDAGLRVYARGAAYTVVKDNTGQYLIVCSNNGYTVGLHGMTGTAYEHVMNADAFSVFETCAALVYNGVWLAAAKDVAALWPHVLKHCGHMTLANFTARGYSIDTFNV